MTTPKITVLRGYSRSGKSTLAAQMASEDTIIVSRDSLRATISGVPGIKTVFDHTLESIVTDTERTMARTALRAGKNVVVDDTNLRSKYVRSWRTLALQEGADFTVVSVMTSIEECLRRTGSKTPASVVTSQGKRYPMHRWESFPDVVGGCESLVLPYVPDTRLPVAAGFDLDGTLAHMNGRGPYDSAQYAHDLVDPVLRELAWTYFKLGYAVVVFTGRSEDHRDVVEAWLNDNAVPYTELLMRPSGDSREDWVVKSELFDAAIAPKYNFVVQFDDRDQVVQALRSKGIRVFQVANGAF